MKKKAAEGKPEKRSPIPFEAIAEYATLLRNAVTFYEEIVKRMKASKMATISMRNEDTISLIMGKVRPTLDKHLGDALDVWGESLIDANRNSPVDTAANSDEAAQIIKERASKKSKGES